MHRIEVDDEVYEVLEGNVKGFEQPNDVLRRLLLGEGAATKGARIPGGRTATSVPGRLLPLIEGGVVRAGEALSHVQVRKGRRFEAVIEPDGWVRTEKGRYREPSPALGDLVGTAIDGWAYWMHEPSGKSLRQLRAKVGGTGRGGR